MWFGYLFTSVIVFIAVWYRGKTENNYCDVSVKKPFISSMLNHLT